MKNNIKLYVIYCVYVGKDSDNYNIYHFLLSENIESVFVEGWEEIPACNMKDIQPDDSMYDYVKELKTILDLDLAQNCCCFSMSDCKDHCVALACENISQYEEYPENGRIVIQFGDNIDDVESMLAKRDLSMKFI